MLVEILKRTVVLHHSNFLILEKILTIDLLLNIDFISKLFNYIVAIPVLNRELSANYYVDFFMYLNNFFQFFNTFIIYIYK